LPIKFAIDDESSRPFFLGALCELGLESGGLLQSFPRPLPASKYARLLEMALGVPPSEGFIFD